MHQFKVNPKRQFERWEFLSTRNIRHRGNWDNERPESVSKGTNNPNNNINKSPFDCSDLIDDELDFDKLVSKHISAAISKWKDLNDRRIVSYDSNVSKMGSGRKRDNTEDKVHLPFLFDYKNKLESPPLISENQSDARKVLDIVNPGNTLYYETELWKIFNALPKAEDLEDIIKEKIVTASASEDIPKQTLILKRCIDDIRSEQFIDVHAMSRVRMKARHHFPSSGSALISETRHGYKSWQVQETQPNLLSRSSFSKNTSIRLEFMKKQYSRGPILDNNRLELEFLGSQSLLDVHKAITKHARDASFDVSSSFAFESGLFFIEDVFYVTGQIDYSKEIIEWLKATNGPRFDALGISMRNLRVKPMSESLLSNLSFRIGVRYVHLFHGNIQTNCFFTCVRPLTSNEITGDVESYPLILDEWSLHNNLSQTCYACQHRTATCVCINDEFTNGDPTMLCSRCYFSLHYGKDGKPYKNNFRVFPLDLFNRNTLDRISKNALF